jgi:hypothetical protein
MVRRSSWQAPKMLVIAILALPWVLRAQEVKPPHAPVERLEPLEILLQPERLDPLNFTKERPRFEGQIKVHFHVVHDVLIVGQLSDKDEGDRDDEEEEEGEAPPGLDQTISDSVFAHWVFGMENIRDARRRLKEILGTRVDEVETTYQISPVQKHKLELAGKGDIERFFDHVAEKRKELDRLQVNEHKTRRFVLTELIPLRGKMRQGPFGEGSLFNKTLNKMLNEKQLMRKSS